MVQADCFRVGFNPWNLYSACEYILHRYSCQSLHDSVIGLLNLFICPVRHRFICHNVVAYATTYKHHIGCVHSTKLSEVLLLLTMLCFFFQIRVDLSNEQIKSHQTKSRDLWPQRFTIMKAESHCWSHWPLWEHFPALILNFDIHSVLPKSMSDLVILGRKCVLAASYAALGEPRWVCATRSIKVREKDGTDRQTDGRQTVTVRLPIDAANAMKQDYTQADNLALPFSDTQLSPS